jgi:anti-anti-sigma factor
LSLDLSSQVAILRQTVAMLSAGERAVSREQAFVILERLDMVDGPLRHLCVGATASGRRRETDRSEVRADTRAGARCRLRYRSATLLQAKAAPWTLGLLATEVGMRHRVTIDEIDAATAPAFNEELADAVSRATKSVGDLDLDFSQVVFMGSNGIKAIVEADRCLQGEGGGRVIVHDAREHIRRLFAIAGVADYLADDPGN